MDLGKMDQDKTLFTIGEFKKLCITTRETLYHYEKMGLLCPTVDETNGYRYYTPYDYYTFMFIAHLTRLGFTLNEVHQYLEHQTLDSYFEAIDTSNQRSRETMEQLMLRQTRLQRGFDYILRSQNKPLDRPQITYREKEYFLKIPFDHSNPIVSDVECSYEHDRYAMEQGIDIQRHYHGFFSEHPFEGPTPVFDCSISKLNEYYECDRLFVMPEGMYISMLYRGPFHSDPARSYQIIREYLEEHRFTPMTGMFVDIVTGPFHTRNETEYLAKLSIRIE